MLMSEYCSIGEFLIMELSVLTSDEGNQYGNLCIYKIPKGLLDLKLK